MNAADLDAAIRCVAAWATLLDPIRATAHRLGYTVAVHGSIARDLDLIAVPWDAECVEARELAHAIARLISAGQPGGFVKLDGPHPKFHGRLAFGISLGGTAYLDLSVLPRHVPPHGTLDSPD